MRKYILRCWFPCCIFLVLASTYTNAEIQSGSGFIVHPDGYIVTNHHVIKNAKEIIVSTQTESKFRAEIIAIDDVRDIALLKVDASRLPYAPLGDSALIKILDTIVVLGFPLAHVIGTEVSAYEGKINAVRRGNEVSILQLDANINPGNSGGPVVNSRGEVIGVVVAKLNAMLIAKESGSIPERVNFSIPINDVKSLLKSKRIAYDTSTRNTNDLSAQSVFELSRSFTVLIIVNTEDVRATESNADENLQIKVRAIINNLLDESKELISKLELYAEEVDYFDKGIVNKKFIYNDRTNYMRRWPYRSYWLKRITEIVPDKTRTVAVARYTIGFEVRGSQGGRKGEAELAILIGNLNTQPKIYLIKEWITDRQQN